MIHASCSSLVRALWLQRRFDGHVIFRTYGLSVSQACDTLIQSHDSGSCGRRGECLRTSLQGNTYTEVGMCSVRFCPYHQGAEAPTSLRKLLELATPHFLDLNPSLAASVLVACADLRLSLPSAVMQSYVMRLGTVARYSVSQLSFTQALQVWLAACFKPVLFFSSKCLADWTYIASTTFTFFTVVAASVRAYTGRKEM